MNNQPAAPHKGLHQGYSRPLQPNSILWALFAPPAAASAFHFYLALVQGPEARHQGQPANWAPNTRPLEPLAAMSASPAARAGSAGVRCAPSRAGAAAPLPPTATACAARRCPRPTTFLARPSCLQAPADCGTQQLRGRDAVWLRRNPFAHGGRLSRAGQREPLPGQPCRGQGGSTNGHRQGRRCGAQQGAPGPHDAGDGGV